MLLTRKKQPTKALLKDVGKAASRLADESRSVAQTARTELGGLSSELRDQASETMTHARQATASRLAGAAQAVEPSGKKRRRRGLRLLIPAVLGGVVAAKIARHRREQNHAEDQEQAKDELADTLSEKDAATAPTPPKPPKSSNARTAESATR